MGAPKEQGHETLGANPWASFPSDHLAAAAMVAMLVWEVDRRAGAAAWAYAGLLGAALVYLGEHYVLELIAGLALAELVRRAERTLRNAAGR